MIKKNRFIAKIIIAGILLVAIKTNSNATDGTIKGSAIRLRKEPNTEATVVDTYGDGEKVDVIEKTGEWYKITIQGKTGYVYQDYINVEGKIENVADNKKEEESKKQEVKKEEENKTENKEESSNKENNKVENKTENNEETKQGTTIKLGKIKATSAQKIYIIPNIGSSTIGEVKKDADVNVIQEVNGWAYVSTNEISGWTRYEKIANEDEKDKISTYDQKQENKKEDNKKEENGDNKNTTNSNEEKNKKTNENNKANQPQNNTETNKDVTTNEKKAYINGTSVNFRKKADTSSDVIKSLDTNTEVTIISEDGEWYKIKAGNETGYVSKQFVSDSKVKEITSRGAEEREVKTTSNGKVTGDDIVSYAKQFLGYKYVYGEESPAKGFDCSGLVWYVYKHYGYNVSRSSSALANDGKTISNKKDLKPGDILIFKAYNDYSRIGHVGIYIGNNQFIHANDEKTGVIITSLDYGKYPERFVSGRRIID